MWHQPAGLLKKNPNMFNLSRHQFISYLIKDVSSIDQYVVLCELEHLQVIFKKANVAFEYREKKLRRQVR